MQTQMSLVKFTIAKKQSNQGMIKSGETVAGGDPTAIISDALRHFGSYHTHPVLERRGDRVFPGEMNLLLYYHNRLEGYGLEAAALGREVA